METVQIVLDKELLRAADRAARKTKQNRSMLVRDALRAYLRRLDTLAREAQDHNGYLKKPPSAVEAHAWEAEAAWPDE
ncbi:MAG: ribbon-helix-helix protein, CopG family [Acidobacteriaceae bacterium]